MKTIVAADRVSFSIRGKILVEDAGLSLDAGCLTVAIGPNGAGKSTLFRLLTGELRPSSGLVVYDGRPVDRFPAWRLACKRAVMAQAAQLSFPFTVYDIARIGLDGIGPGTDRRDSIIASCLALADVSHLAERDYQTLSGGEQQRVQFARVLCQLEAGRRIEMRQVLFLDEPVASLDLSHQLALMDAAQNIAARGIAVFAILHDLNLAATYADRLIVMSEGRIVAQGDARDVLTRSLVKEVFKVDLPLSETPSGSMPFVLPQHHKRSRGILVETAPLYG